MTKQRNAKRSPRTRIVAQSSSGRAIRLDRRGRWVSPLMDNVEKLDYSRASHRVATSFARAIIASIGGSR